MHGLLNGLCGERSDRLFPFFTHKYVRLLNRVMLVEVQGIRPIYSRVFTVIFMRKAIITIKPFPRYPTEQVSTWLPSNDLTGDNTPFPLDMRTHPVPPHISHMAHTLSRSSVSWCLTLSNHYAYRRVVLKLAPLIQLGKMLSAQRTV